MTEGVLDLHDDLAARARRRRPLKAVVLAGGKGTRLAPYTSVLPKPLMPIGDRSILELVLGQFAACGITDVTLCVGHLSHLIQAVLDNRPDDGVEIKFVHENQPLGTAAPLRLVEGLDPDLHRDERRCPDDTPLRRFPPPPPTQPQRRDDRDASAHDADRLRRPLPRREWPAESGRVLRREAADDCDREHGHLCRRAGGAGIHPRRGRFDFPDLVKALLRAGEKVGAYRHDGLWFDIGRRDDYEEAVEAWVELPTPVLTATAVAAAASQGARPWRPEASRTVYERLPGR